MQFAARFNLQPAPETVVLCRRIKAHFHELAVERITEEWLKWAAKSAKPSAGLHWLVATEWIEHFPEVNALRGVPQDPEWHPEGDVFVHTCHCCDALVQLPEWQAADTESRIVYTLTVLAHDFAKPQTTHQTLKNGQLRIVSPEHEKEGGPVAERFLERLHVPRHIRERVLPLVIHHMAHLNPITDRFVRRLAKRLEPENIDGLGVIIKADHAGRPPKPSTTPKSLLRLQAKASELQVQAQAPKPILLGRHLLAYGLNPSKEFRTILDAAYQAQLAGKIHNLDQALAWLAQRSN
jgi:tRNA nucleotidyltransferase (CCA-adding enzyme)